MNNVNEPPLPFVFSIKLELCYQLIAYISCFHGNVTFCLMSLNEIHIQGFLPEEINVVFRFLIL